jgi:diguanylate cyclase (GGDEF)-like protein
VLPPLYDVATAAHLAGTIVLALFFILLARHDRRPYLREWTFAWIAQVAALSVLLFGRRPALWPMLAGPYLVCTTLHGLFLGSAAHRYARGIGLSRRFTLTVTPVALVSLASGWLFEDWSPLQAATGILLATTHVIAAWLLWPYREKTAMGLRLVTNLLLILGLRHVFHAVLFLSPLAVTRDWRDYEAVLPFTTLLLQMLLALGMVLAAMEAGQRQLEESNNKLEEAKRRLKMLADTDPMTGCFNRRVFRDLVDEVRADTQKRGGTLLVLDMDGLKGINDTQGHSAGDQAIRRTADAIRLNTREGDLVLRWGGDEFVVILPGITRDEARRRADGMSAAIAELGLGASVGSCDYGPARDIVLALRDADRQMYEAKAARKAQAAAAST